VGDNKPAKYRNRKVIADGHKFDSVREHDRYVELKALRDNGKITGLELQPKYWLKSGKNDIKIRSERYPNGRRTSYTADFVYIDDRGVTHVEDVKGMDTNVSRLRRAIVEAQYGIRVEIVR
jgi:hypothetical protein